MVTNSGGNDASPAESAVQHLARKYGYVLRKSRAGEDLNQCGEYMLIDEDTATIVLGERYDATLEDISAFFADDEPSPNSLDLILLGDEDGYEVPDFICIDENKGFFDGNIIAVSPRLGAIMERVREVRATAKELRAVADFMERELK